MPVLCPCSLYVAPACVPGRTRDIATGAISLYHKGQVPQGKLENLQQENAVSEIEELQKIQREASARRAERENKRLAARAASRGQQAEPCTETPSAGAAPNGNFSAEAEGPTRALTHQLGNLLEELEEAAKERPALALLAAFSLGVIVGQLFSRK